MAKDAARDITPYVNHISAYEREFKKWETRNEKIVRRYRDDATGTRTTARFNILWANVQTLVPATFSRLPQPDVSRRFRDNDPVGRVAALIVERALDFEIQHYPDYRTTLKACVYDRFLGGRGTCWARYEPHIRAVEKDEAEDGAEVTEDIDEPEEELEYECAPVDYVHWRDFGHAVARTWEEVTLVWRKVYMTRDACVERFGEEEGNLIPLDSKPDDKTNKTQQENQDSRALIHEIWDKEKQIALWLCKSLGRFVDEKPDPLGLDEFFPCPKPLYATLTNETLVPVPDFTLYQDQAAELDTLCDRIQGLIEALQVKGVYNSEFPVLARLFTEGENGKMLPVKDFAAFAEKSGLKGAIDLVDLKPIYEALLAAYKAVEEIKSQIYDITGLADIIRGQSESDETATAQEIKGQYASMRLNSMKHDVAQFATDILRLKAQIMMGKFSAESLLELGGAKQMSPEDQAALPRALALLQDHPTRTLRIEVAADSLVEMDESKEKRDRMEMITAVGSALKSAEPIVQAAPELAPMILELIKFGVSAFKIGKTVEGTIDEALDNLKQTIKAKQGQPPPPSPEQLKIQGQMQIEQGKVQAKQQSDAAQMQVDQQRAQAEMQLEQQRLAMEAQARERELQAEAAARAQEQQMEAQRAVLQAHFDARLETWKTEFEGRIKLEVAEITKQTALEGAQITAAQAGSQE